MKNYRNQGINMSVKNLLIASYSAIAIAIFVIIVLNNFMHVNNEKLEQAEVRRHQSYLLADELRQSSDDLTRLARAYVVSGNPKYEKMYWHILAIRNGEKPRPQKYNRIYWDLVLEYGDKPRPDGETVALQRLMENMGFTEEEFAKLREAQNNSDSLVTTETIAMNAVKGLYDDGTGNYTKKGEPDWEMARRIMHDEKYHQDKAAIMKPIDEFFELFQARTAKKVQHFRNRSELLIVIMQVFSVFLALFSIGAGLIATRRILKQVGGEPADIAKITEKVAVGDLNVKFDDKKASTGIYAAVQAMVKNLQKIQIEREAQNFVKTGQMELGEIMSGEQDIETLAKKVIAFLTGYVDAQIGLFYVVTQSDSEEDEKVFLKRIADYAYTAREEMPSEFEIGEGLAGQAALEKKPLLRTYKSKEYQQITQSGLTNAVPRTILFLPFLYEGEVKGVIEIGFSKTLTTVQQDFLEQVMPIIGIAVNTTESRDKMRFLLAQMQEQSEEMRQQQEELRQTNEQLEDRASQLEEKKGKWEVH